MNNRCHLAFPPSLDVKHKKISFSAPGAIWRSDDPLGVKPKSDKSRVNVFSSSGFSSRHKQPKISLHFVWPDLIVSPREAKGERKVSYLSGNGILNEKGF
jgi:hypothetical protein